MSESLIITDTFASTRSGSLLGGSNKDTAIVSSKYNALPYIPEDKISSVEKVYQSYAGVDIVAQIVLPYQTPIILGELQTISYSIHRENAPVRTLGHVSPIGFVKGSRTIGGSLVFTNFNQYAFYRLEQFRIALANQGIYPISDMLPPFDVVLTFANEYASFSKLRIYGVTIIDEGTTMSVDDLITESTMTYMARGITPMIPINVKSTNTTSTAGNSFNLG